MAGLIGVKSQSGMSFVRPERVIAVQVSPTGGTIVVLEGGTQVASVENSTAIAGRVKAAEEKAEPSATSDADGSASAKPGGISQPPFRY